MRNMRVSSGRCDGDLKAEGAGEHGRWGLAGLVDAGQHVVGGAADDLPPVGHRYRVDPRAVCVAREHSIAELTAGGLALIAP